MFYSEEINGFFIHVVNFEPFCVVPLVVCINREFKLLYIIENGF